ncbi:Proteasome lid subunit RPN8/RPN11, contains Jab1/MPN metalloenzyme (JAMM) motif [Halorubrum ezzemoulense]|uniref:Proteasome lid subunit RPN8/RPN11, contains Jab1/MPN metalloenzyme (JAMM) motif n=1 Tax=Halorubrum ezzemoulense TaxID=337243 RepID=A0A238YTD4_HALEZ|nr:MULTISPECIES: desampylase [Halorubrum]TKX39935.1 M67 family peptidase [Halorubrum sp. CGM4_25_10-8A]TKX63329.1 M67 family peptidase [Halorubrum sp. GN12_10-3_MGM]SNR74202.1 Proteasome lid subunit RPN8/RPN11, contains Jab1/MPN metalloenzyme (JAMM) motif [Halorubrum ezzemoulense]
MIKLTRAAYDDIMYRAYKGGEAEICGVLAGEHGTDGDKSVVTGTYAAENVAETPEIRYLIDPEEQLELIETVEEAGLDVVGFYHSHPTGPAHPSETDAAQATWPDHSYVICALDGYPFVGSWRWRDNEEAFEQETVSIRSER